MLYHVYVALKHPPKDSEIKLGLSEDELFKRVLRPYRQGRAFVLNGRAIQPDNILRVRVTRGETPVEHLMARAKAEDRASSVVFLTSDHTPYMALDYCEDVTDSYIDGPPGIRPRRRPTTRKPRSKTAKPRTQTPASNDFSIDESSFSVTWRGKTHVFEARGKLLFALLARLVCSKGQAVAFEQLQAKGDVWGGAIVSDTTIRGAVTRLKKKLRGAEMADLADLISVDRYKGRPYVILTLPRSTSRAH